MSTSQINEPHLVKPLRLWPGVVAAVLLVLVRFALPVVYPAGAIWGILGAVALGLVITLWWLLFSRAPWLERFGILTLMIAAAYATMFVVHESIRGGMMGRMVPFVLAIPGLPVALVIGAVASRGLTPQKRRVVISAMILLACGLFALLRTDGVMGEGVSQITWRWTPTAEERLLAQGHDTPVNTAPAPDAAPAEPAQAPTPDAVTAPRPDSAADTTAEKPPAVKADAKPADTAAHAASSPAMTPAGAKAAAEWPGFRGSDRNSVVRGVRIDTDWAKSPPVTLWRRAIGPAWSSFAVHADRIYTQEQRGNEEIVASYNLASGKPIWMHKDAARFYESNGGPGPRGTPAISDGHVYTLGATGILNALDARSGAVRWSRNAAADAGVKIPGWGIAGSPLVVDDMVVVSASGALLAYERATGHKRWAVESTGGSYSSPQLVTIHGTPQILLMGGSGTTGVAPGDGTVLWRHPWVGSPIVQPAVIGDGDILITSADMMGGLGLRRIAVTQGPGGWTAEERWTSRGLKPYFNDYVVHNGHAFGFDGSILAAIDLTDGARKWKGGRYGNGQLVLLPEQDLLLVLSEDGELALVSATPDEFKEIARAPAIEGKTWNHPVLVNNVLLVRNGQEMAAFRLPAAHR
jgi:outer membrane protein assembly factor BamB